MSYSIQFFDSKREQLLKKAFPSAF